jgi:hypothetical protein
VLTGLSAAMTGDHDRARGALGDVVTLPDGSMILAP